MTWKYLLFVFIVGTLFLHPLTISAQSQPDTTELKKLVQTLTELEYQYALTDYVENLFAKYGAEKIPQEKYLVSIMRLVNEEMHRRIKNPRKMRDRYFEQLSDELSELLALKQRLKDSGISELKSYTDDLEVRLRYTIRAGEIDYKKKKVFEDALQLLYVAEEMIKMDQLKEPENLNKKIKGSKERLFQVFGQVTEVSSAPLEKTPTIFDLFQVWKETQTYRFDARLLDVKLIRSNLIKSGSLQEVQRMFDNELGTAYNEFNYFDYDLTDRLLEDIVNTYSEAGVKDFEDVYYYWGESNFALNRFSRAREIYEKLLKNYPSSAFLPKVYSRLIQITYKLGDDESLLSYFSQYQNVASPSAGDFYDIQFMVALTLYGRSDFNQAIDIFLSFPRKSSFYHLTRYLLGTVYASAQNYDLAENVFTNLIDAKDTPPDIFARSLYKMGLISYQQGEYTSALTYLGQVPLTYGRYDKVLNALAWANFKLAEEKKTMEGTADYSQAVHYANLLINNYYASEHRMEAESLIAYIAQQQNQPDFALGLYQDVYEAKRKEKSVTGFLVERDSLSLLYDKARQMKNQALRNGHPEAYGKASSLADNLHDQLLELEIAELSPVGSEITQEVNEILDQLDQLKEIKAKAKSDGNLAVVQKVDSTIIRLTAVLDRFPEKYLKGAIAYNWFDAYPVTREVAGAKFQAAKLSNYRTEIQNELNLIDSKIVSLRNEANNKKTQADFRGVNRIEQNIAKFMELRKKYDRLYTETFDMTIKKPYAEFDKWGDFGAFGIIDVRFGQRDRLQVRMGEVSQIYNTAMDMLNQRRLVIDDKLKKIDAEIRFMTMKARIEERMRLRAERERKFRETYFDKRTSEFEEK